MFRQIKPLFLAAFILQTCIIPQTVSAQVPVAGVSRSLAVYRKSVLSAVKYKLALDIPTEKSAPIRARQEITFNSGKIDQTLQLDFKADAKVISLLEVNGKKVPVKLVNEHLLIGPDLIKNGENHIKVNFIAGNGALNRNADYLYTLFVPDRARTAFPCFDQPDIKATYLLQLTVPSSWHAIANATQEYVREENGRKIYQFRESDLLSTYLFAFAAGKFHLYKGNLQGKNADLLYRETDTAKLTPSLPAIYAIHEQSLKFFEEWTGIPYPFQKFGMSAIPEFQFGGMEHPGSIHYKESSLFLDRTASRDQLNTRTNLIAHETAHMWFGDLVTMDWFSDVWMKEVFANFMADKSTVEPNNKAESDQKFLISHVPAAYAVDRTPGANPIRQELDNLNEAGTLYGNIIYHKAPVMMKQLESLMGESAFQSGVREYLRRFSNSNASWPDLIRILDSHTSADLIKWNSVWVNDNGRPVVTYKLEQKGGLISRFTVSQHAEQGKDRNWPQQFKITLYYQDRIKELPVNLIGKDVVITAAEGLQAPLYMIFNTGGEGYGRMPVDPALPVHIYDVKDPLSRASAYIGLYEQMLSGESIRPEELLELYKKGLLVENDELNLKLICTYIGQLYWQFSKADLRIAIAPSLEMQIWTALSQNKFTNQRKQLFKLYQDIFLSREAKSRLYQIWKEQLAPEGVILTEDDYTSLALALAIRDDASKDILRLQNLRITNTDRKERFEMIMPAASSDLQERDLFFNSLKQISGRAKESTVLTALYYLHHPLRQESSVHYLMQSLEMLVEIQKTGDIFFPQSWLQASFGMYSSVEAANIVEEFLKLHPGYSPKLKAKILQATDNLFRARKLDKQ